LAHRWTVLLALSSALAACAGGGATASPRGTLHALQSAAERGDAAALYALLPAAARRQESLEAFRARIASEQPELRGLGTAIQQALQDQREPVVEVPLVGGGATTVVEDVEGWRMARSGFGPAATPTPADAARAMRTALQQQSLPALLAVLSSRARGALQAEISALIDALSDAESLGVTATSSAGQRLEVRLPDGRTLVMVREGGAWRIDDVL
jgi:hypothetical protein